MHVAQIMYIHTYHYVYIYLYTPIVYIFVLNTIYISYFPMKIAIATATTQWPLPRETPFHLISNLSHGGRELRGKSTGPPKKNNVWLVVYLPLWKIWKSVGSNSPNIWNNKIHVPNHQPGDSMHASMEPEIGELLPTNLIPLLWKIPPHVWDLKSWLEE